MSTIDGDWESARTGYSPKTLYARTKREEVVVTEHWPSGGAAAGSSCMGWADTEGVQRWMPMSRTITRPIIRSSEEGADTIVWIGGAPEALERTGLFWQDRRPRPTHYRLAAGPDSEEDRQALWRYCVDALAEAGITGL